MTDDAPGSPVTPGPPDVPVRAPGNRVAPGLVIAIAVAALMLLGIVGLVAAAVLGDDDGDPTGVGLRPTVNVDEPATAPPATGGSEPEDSTNQSTGQPEPTPTTGAAADDTAASTGDAAPDDAGSEPSGEQASGDDDFSDEPTLTTAVAVNDIEQPDESDLPEPGEEPVELPVQVTTPAPPSTYAPVPFDELGPEAVGELDGWSESDRDADHVAFSNGGEVVEMFLIDGVATADEALEHFYDDVRPDLEELARSPITRLGAPSGRFVSVAGSEYSATSAGQQGTSTMSGSIVAAVRADGSAIVLTTSRAGSSSVDELAGDGQLLTAILAHL